jgi:hypothetical protein
MFGLRKLFCALLLIPLLAGGGILRVEAQAGPVSESEFWQLVQESHIFFAEVAQVDELDAAQEAGLEALAVRWAAIQQVRLENGTLVGANGAYWARVLRERAPESAEHFAVLLAERARPGQAEWASDGLSGLQTILARPEYQWPEETPGLLDRLWEQLRAWLSEWLGDSPGLSVSSEASDWTLDLLNILAFVFVAVILAYAIKTMFSDFTSESALDANAPHEMPLNARQALKQADTFSQIGDYRTAVRYLYLSALLILDERGLLYYDRAQTNREYLRQVAGNAQVAGLLREVINVFDQVWYGFQPLDEESYQRYAARVRELENQP